MKNTARAVLWIGEQSFELIDVTIPDLRPGEVLVEMEYATICGSDRHTVSGRRAQPCPSILGHEGVGTVHKSRRPEVQPGQRIVFGVTDACGTCENCQRGHTAKCQRVRKLGHERFEQDLFGTYSTHVVLPAGTAIAVVPENLPGPQASTAGCAVATVMAMVEQAGPMRGRRVLIMGLGMLGITAVVAARAAGAAYITAVDPNPQAREAVAHLIDSSTDTPVDIAFELSGTAVGAQTCVDSLDLYGRAVLAGTVAPVGTVSIDPEVLVRGWKTITGVHNYEPRHLNQAVAFLSEHGDQIPWERVLGDTISLSDVAVEFTRESTGRTVVKL